MSEELTEMRTHYLGLPIYDAIAVNRVIADKDKQIAEMRELLGKSLSKLEGLQAWIYLEKLDPSTSVDRLINKIKQNLGEIVEK